MFKTRISVEMKKIMKVVEDFIGREKLEKAVREVMTREERRIRAKKLAKMVNDAEIEKIFIYTV